MPVFASASLLSSAVSGLVHAAGSLADAFSNTKPDAVKKNNSADQSKDAVQAANLFAAYLAAAAHAPAGVPEAAPLAHSPNKPVKISPISLSNGSASLLPLSMMMAAGPTTAITAAVALRSAAARAAVPATTRTPLAAVNPSGAKAATPAATATARSAAALAVLQATTATPHTKVSAATAPAGKNTTAPAVKPAPVVTSAPIGLSASASAILNHPATKLAAVSVAPAVSAPVHPPTTERMAAHSAAVVHPDSVATAPVVKAATSAASATVRSTATKTALPAPTGAPLGAVAPVNVPTLKAAPPAASIAVPSAAAQAVVQAMTGAHHTTVSAAAAPAVKSATASAPVKHSASKPAAANVALTASTPTDPPASNPAPANIPAIVYTLAAANAPVPKAATVAAPAALNIPAPKIVQPSASPIVHPAAKPAATAVNVSPASARQAAAAAVIDAANGPTARAASVAALAAVNTPASKIAQSSSSSAVPQVAAAKSATVVKVSNPPVRQQAGESVETQLTVKGKQGQSQPASSSPEKPAASGTIPTSHDQTTIEIPVLSLYDVPTANAKITSIAAAVSNALPPERTESSRGQVPAPSEGKSSPHMETVPVVATQATYLTPPAKISWASTSHIDPNTKRDSGPQALSRDGSQPQEPANVPVTLQTAMPVPAAHSMTPSVVSAHAEPSNEQSNTPIAEQLTRAFVSNAELVSREGRTDFHLRLEPPQLGSVQIHLTAEDHTISARVVVSQEGARQVIERQAQHLRQSLAEVGLVLGKFDVTHGGGGSSDGGRRPPPEAPMVPPPRIASPAPAVVSKTTRPVPTDGIDILA